MLLGIFLALRRPIADELHLRRRADADRAGLHVLVFAVGPPEATSNWAPRPRSWSAIGVIFTSIRCPGPILTMRSVGVSPDWPHLEGIAAHWDKNTNAAACVRPVVFEPVSASQAVRLQRRRLSDAQLHPLAGHDDFRSAVRANCCVARERTAKSSGGWSSRDLAGLAAGRGPAKSAGICPIVKRIWTPSWALFSTGWTCLILAAFFGVVDMLKFRKWTFPLIVVGMNSITMYLHGRD